MGMWIPYMRVPESDNLTYMSFYNNTKTISHDLWDPKNNSKGEKCVYCSYLRGCSDAPCTKNQYAHICSFSAGAPIAQLKGFCPATELGKKDLNNHNKLSLRSLDKTQECWRLYFTSYSLMFLAAMNLLGAISHAWAPLTELIPS